MEISEPKQNWGGPWTEKKLDAFSKYVWSYLKIMKSHNYWKTIYFDGFAGSGSRTSDTDSELYKQLEISFDEERVYEGAAERILKIEDGLEFDYYYFVDKNRLSLESLEQHLDTVPERKDKKLSFKEGDVNFWLKELTRTLKIKDGYYHQYASLIFLDPFGMQIDWQNIADLKGTKSDIWILVPTGMIVNRLLDRKGRLRSIKLLESFFGLSEEEIRKEFYNTTTANTLFGEEEKVTKILNPIEKISNLYVKQLKTIWKYVTEPPLRLNNSKGVPIFHFVFASNNENARKIAEQIITKK